MARASPVVPGATPGRRTESGRRRGLQSRCAANRSCELCPPLVIPSVELLGVGAVDPLVATAGVGRDREVAVGLVEGDGLLVVIPVSRITEVTLIDLPCISSRWRIRLPSPLPRWDGRTYILLISPTRMS